MMAGWNYGKQSSKSSLMDVRMPVRLNTGIQSVKGVSVNVYGRK